MKNMIKKLGALALIIGILLGVFTAAVFAADNAKAVKSSSKLLLDGEEASFDAYNINGSNYFKLRDLAYKLSGTSVQFEVAWDAGKNAIFLFSGKPYTPIGGEMAVSNAANAPSYNATPTVSTIYLNGIERILTAYLINGNNYFKLRDIAEVFDFFVGWDDKSKTITIDTNKKYMLELTDDAIYNKIIALKAKYPQGMEWGDDKYYIWKGGIYRGGYGCLAFASIVSDEVFGNLPARRHTDFDKMKVGDIFRYNSAFGEHSVVVLIIGDTGITIAEGNYDKAIYWERELTWEEIKSKGIHVTTRYPE